MGRYFVWIWIVFVAAKALEVKEAQGRPGYRVYVNLKFYKGDSPPKQMEFHACLTAWKKEDGNCPGGEATLKKTFAVGKRYRFSIPVRFHWWEDAKNKQVHTRLAMKYWKGEHQIVERDWIVTGFRKPYDHTDHRSNDMASVKNADGTFMRVETLAVVNCMPGYAGPNCTMPCPITDATCPYNPLDYGDTCIGPYFGENCTFHKWYVYGVVGGFAALAYLLVLLVCCKVLCARLKARAVHQQIKAMPRDEREGYTAVVDELEERFQRMVIGKPPRVDRVNFVSSESIGYHSIPGADKDATDGKEDENKPTGGEVVAVEVHADGDATATTDATERGECTAVYEVIKRGGEAQMARMESAESIHHAEMVEQMVVEEEDLDTPVHDVVQFYMDNPTTVDEDGLMVTSL